MCSSSRQRMESEAPSHLLENAINISWPLISSHRLMRIKRWRVCADLHAIPRRNVSFVSSKRENKRSFEWNDLNRREKVPKQQASAEKMQQRFCALHHSRPNDLDGDERKGT